eukprot:GAHX01006651.1.p2 GENE.GAHX01006651.1~~GAHX01006651.1.p2  ORF type:complete len:57 (-),score=3.73 GAHX01006651.1:470-640(-)
MNVCSTQETRSYTIGTCFTATKVSTGPEMDTSISLQTYVALPQPTILRFQIWILRS